MLQNVLDFLSQGFLAARWWVLLLYLLTSTQLTIFTVTLFYHRSQTHRSVDFHPVINHLFRFWGWLATGMVVKEWVAIHRKHHAKVETTDDPHSPQVYGIKRVFWQGVDLYQAATRNRADIESYGRGTPDDWIERHLYSAHSALGPTLMLVINAMCFGAWGVALWAVQMIWIPLWAAGFVNGLGHWWGYRNFETQDTACNISPWGFWIGGEELHNNHHAFPSSAKFAFRKWELDAGWLAICAFRTLHLARVLRVAPPLSRGRNVVDADEETLRSLRVHRCLAMTHFNREVMLPIVRARPGGKRQRPCLSKTSRDALASGGRWLTDIDQRAMRAQIARQPSLVTANAFRERLMDLIDLRDERSAIVSLRKWIEDSQQSGIAQLALFGKQLKGYSSRQAPFGQRQTKQD